MTGATPAPFGPNVTPGAVATGRQRRTMRARPLTLLIATAAVAMVVVAGCEAKVQAKTSGTPDYSTPTHSPPSSPQLAELLLQVITRPLPPGSTPSAGL